MKRKGWKENRVDKPRAQMALWWLVSLRVDESLRMLVPGPDPLSPNRPPVSEKKPTFSVLSSDIQQKSEAQRDRISLSATNASLLWCEHSSLSFTPTVLVLNGLHIDTVPPTGCECITSATSAVQLSCVHAAWWLSDIIKGAQPCVWG